MLLHRGKKLGRQRETSLRTKDRVDAAVRAQRGLTDTIFVFVDPLFDQLRLEGRQAIEAATERAFLDLLPMAARILVCAMVVAAFMFVNQRHVFFG